MKVKTYNELSQAEKKQTFENWQNFCIKENNDGQFESFADYDMEQKILDLDFDAETLECLG